MESAATCGVAALLARGGDFELSTIVVLFYCAYFLIAPFARTMTTEVALETTLVRIDPLLSTILALTTKIGHLYG